MKKLTLTLLAAAAALSANAQTILSEDFETGNTGSAPQPVAVGTGWTVVNGYTGTQTKYNWHNYYSNPEGDAGSTLGGACCAAVDAAMFDSDKEGKGPREEILLSPEVSLDGTYQLQFSWKVSPMNAYEASRYDLQVRVVEDGDLQSAETVFSIQNSTMLRESGVNVFPIQSWDPYTSRIDLSDWQGKKVKLAFVYKMMGPTGNVAYLDDISVKQFTPPTGPVASLSMDRYQFRSMFIGEKYYSDAITLTNTGKDGLQITGIDCPAGFSTTIANPESVDLLMNQSINFRLSYQAALTSAVSGDVVFHTTGGDVKVAVTASKEFVPEGFTLETFPRVSTPAGWESKGWGCAPQAIEGDYSMCGSGDISATTLRTPRLDLSEGGTLKFTYLNYFDSDNPEDAPQYDISLQVSYDGGNSWVTKWTSDYINGLNQVLTAEVDLGLGDDNCYARWYYPAIETDDGGAFSHSTFYLDGVLLPNLYGADGVPMAAKIVSPANNATEIYPKDVKLQWTEAQFAQGYKLYVGTSRAANEVINGLDLGDALSYTIPELAYSTEYRWKVVGYNDKGDCATASTWRFTTQPDATVTTFPYVENFDKSSGVPTGWTCVLSAQYKRGWSVNSLYPYKVDGKEYPALFTTWLNPGEWNAVETPEFKLLSDVPMSISYVWGDEHPSDLNTDPTATVQKHNVEPNNGISAQFFDIYVDGEWHTLSTLSEDSSAKKYWITEKVDLAPYAGKTVKFRWRHESYSNKDDGGSLAHVLIQENKDYRASFNVSEWNAGKVNFRKAAQSAEQQLNILNDGGKDLTVKAVSFATPNFTASLQPGDVIPVKSSKFFTVRFDALDTAAPVSDEMTVEFEGGAKAVFPVKGEALPNGIYYYSFEPNALDYEWEKDFSMIDVDNQRGYSFTSSWVNYSADGAKCAFSCENDSYETGMYGMMSPISGNHALVASAPASGSGADNWIISKKMKAGSKAKFDFYARNWESTGSVLPDPKSEITVLVSTASNTATTDFEVVRAKEEIPYYDYNEWGHFEVDLSAYAGKDVYVALQHTTAGAGNLAFFDDFTFTGFDGDGAGVDDITADLSEDTQVTVYSLSGVKVADGIGSAVLNRLGKGFYVVRATDAKGARSYKLAR